MYSEKELGTELTLETTQVVDYNFIRSIAPGGYIDHVLNVARNSYKLKKVYEETGIKVDFTDEELLFAAFHHDLGKLGNSEGPLYVQETSDWSQKESRKSLQT